MLQRDGDLQVVSQVGGRGGSARRAFRSVFSKTPATGAEIALTSDGNHPTHAGAFLAAVAIYGYLSHDDIANVTWRPFDMTEATAAKLKDIAARHLH